MLPEASLVASFMVSPVPSLLMPYVSSHSSEGTPSTAQFFAQVTGSGHSACS
jgi:hypothetical protein